MFTGLIEKIGQVTQVVESNGLRKLTVAVDSSAYASELGESIAVNGCCLTVTRFDAQTMDFDISFESLSRTNLGALKAGSQVNLERAMRLGDRLGGHMVSGHVDAKALLERIDRQESSWNVFVSLPNELACYVIPKGSITLDGVSLTVNDVHDSNRACLIRLTLIPATIAQTCFSHLEAGWQLNVEVDLVGKYLKRFADPALQVKKS